MGLTYAISKVNWMFEKFLSKKIFFLLFCANFSLLMFHNDIVKSASKLPIILIFAYFATIITMRQMKMFDFENQWL